MGITSGITNAGFINTDDYRLSSPSASINAPGFEQLLERSRLSYEKLYEDSGADARRTSSANTQIDKDDKLYQLCLELETFLVKNLLTSMRNTVQKSGLIEESFAGKMYEDMLYDEYAKDFAKNANFGLAEMAYRQLSGF
jgi:flagellar protein FlgJ